MSFCWILGWVLGMCGLGPLIQLIIIFYFCIFWVSKFVYSSYFAIKHVHQNIKSFNSLIKTWWNTTKQNKIKQRKTYFYENITYKSIKNNKNTNYKNPNQGKTMKRDSPCLLNTIWLIFNWPLNAYNTKIRLMTRIIIRTQ